MWCQFSAGGWCIFSWLLAVRATSLQRQALEIDTRGHLQKVSDEDDPSKFKHQQLMRKAKGRGLEQLQAEAVLLAQNSVAVVQQLAADNALAHSSGRAAPEGEKAFEEAIVGTKSRTNSMPAGKNTGTVGNSKVSCDCTDGGGAEMAAAPLPIGTRCEHRTDGAGDLVALIVPEVCYQQSTRDTMISCVGGEAVITVFLGQDCTGINSSAPLVDIDCKFEPNDDLGHTAEWICEEGAPALEYTFFTDSNCTNRITDCNDAALAVALGNPVTGAFLVVCIILLIIVLVFGSGVFRLMTGYWPWEIEAIEADHGKKLLEESNSYDPNLQPLDPVPSKQPLPEGEDEDGGAG